MSEIRRAAITGWPVVHSRSPLVHGYWLKKHGLEGEYGRQAVEPEGALDFYKDFANSGLIGGNVTIPHKETAAQACDHLDEAAQAMGAVNTLWVDEKGALNGANTDWIGFLSNLDQYAPGWDKAVETALVLGAGGAARAVIYSLLKRGIKTVHIFNRTISNAQKLADEFGTGTIAHSLDELGEKLGTADLLVNTTSLGMTGKPPLEIDLENLPKSAIVTDAIYVPLKTELLKQAEARGNRIVDGLGMLLHQAVPGFERWFGVRPQVDEALRQVILDDLEANG
ncbi:shikimate dehydrogenase [Roseibium sp. CAU 1637]|uniref:Shikimate dehydrogenase (NADP(+)) n=1 Tax=Roseibium limicola TaxID=2816037 RepID=A0A939ERV0_9HYPH|nr:shikimate dehydrogenase [Roseibium limicola]MBO0347160.1 shikimate dehydrogenase [Roseibium limicola]